MLKLAIISSIAADLFVAHGTTFTLCCSTHFYTLVQLNRASDKQKCADNKFQSINNNKLMMVPLPLMYFIARFQLIKLTSITMFIMYFICFDIDVSNNLFLRLFMCLKLVQIHYHQVNLAVCMMHQSQIYLHLSRSNRTEKLLLISYYYHNILHVSATLPEVVYFSCLLTKHQ